MGAKLPNDVIGHDALKCMQLGFLASPVQLPTKKGPRGFRRRSKSGRKRPGEGSDSGGAIAYPILQIKGPRALTGLNFRSRFAFRMADASYRAHADLCRREAQRDGTSFGVA
jgi:hypothetical protein